MVKKKLIINIDDFGYDGDLNQAVIDLVKAEKVSSASILVKQNETGGKQALDFARAYDGKASFGLHC